MSEFTSSINCFFAQASAQSDQLIALRCQLSRQMCRQLSRQMCRQLSRQMCRQMSQLKQLKEVAAVGSRRSTRSHSRRSIRWQSRLVIFFTTYKSRR